MIIKQAMDFVSRYDAEVGSMIYKEFERQCRNIELIASENIVSEAVMAAMGSVLTNKYAEGYPAKRYYGGCECVDEVENLAIDRVCKLSVLNMLMFSLIPVLKLIWLFIRHL